MKRSLCASVVVGLAALSAAPGFAANIVIMPLGDSITMGAYTPSGYRSKLYTNLGGNVDFVGSATDGVTTLPDKDHEGHWGYRTEHITANLLADGGTEGGNGGHWLDGGNGTGRAAIFPDVILLHIGTNDVWAGDTAAMMASHLAGLLDALKAARPDTQVFVASLIPRTDSFESVQQQYNAAIPGIVSDAGSNFHFVDMHSIVTTADLADQLHPSQAGYDKMADAWSEAVDSYYTSTSAVPEPASLMVLGLGSAGLLARRRRGM